MPEKVDVLRAKLRAIRSTLERTPSQEKQNQAGIDLANNFNEMLTQVGSLLPELKEELPKPISAGIFAHMGKANVTYLDLEVLAEQVLALLDLAAEP